VLDEGHVFGPMVDIMDVIHIEKKGRILGTLEKYYVYRETQHVNQINDKLTVQKKTDIWDSNTTQPPQRATPANIVVNTTALTHSRLQAQFVGENHPGTS